MLKHKICTCITKQSVNNAGEYSGAYSLVLQGLVIPCLFALDHIAKEDDI